MKEITRIHLAKTSYDVEIEAKKELERYLAALEKYSGDTGILADIEIRITEILAERGVKKDQVITAADVKALRGQLGEPKEFKQDDDEPLSDEAAEVVGRKLFRDTDNAVLGGVLSGLAAFFGVNPAVARILFILLMLMSFGTALLAYVLLWAVVPPAVTAADKLQMRGRSVTIASIREVNETAVVRRPRMDAEAKKTLLTLAGIICAIGAALTLLFTVMASLAIYFNRYHAFSQEIAVSHLLLGALVAAAASGLLLASLFGIVAYAAFSRKMTKRIIVSICIVISLGLVSFCTAVGLTQYSVFKIRYEPNASGWVAPREFVR